MTGTIAEVLMRFRFLSAGPSKCPYRGALVTMVLASLLTACATSPTQTEPVVKSPALQKTPGDSPSASIRASLQEIYAQWRGTRHRMGGTSKTGVDCSGFVMTVYRNVFHIDLPRTTAEQIHLGIPVPRHALRPGDLVFFNPPGYPRHVGIYLGNNRFLHASKSNGVTLSTIDGGYWASYFRTGRRILPSN